MRIAFDYQIFCHQPYGGISRYFFRLAEQLALMGERAQVFAPFHRNNYLAGLESSTVRGRRVGAYPPKSTRAILELNRVLAKRAIRGFGADVVHETFFAKKRSAPLDCPLVITVYDMIDEIYGGENQTWSAGRSLKRVAIERADHVICISESTRRDLVTLSGIDESKTSVIHLAYDKSSDNRVALQPAAIEGDYILYVGKRAGYKNFDRFIDSVASSSLLLRDFKVIAFGGGAFNENETLRIQKLGYREGQVQQLGGTDSVLANLYRNARAFVYPSLYEGFGLPPLEAMAHDCPVISSNTSSMPEVILDAAEFFNPASIEDMANAIEGVLYSEERIRELRLSSKARLRSFSWEKCAKETLAVYAKIVDSR